MGKTQVTPTMPAIPPLMSLAGRLKKREHKVIILEMAFTVTIKTVTNKIKVDVK